MGASEIAPLGKPAGRQAIVVRVVWTDDRVHISRDGAVELTVAEWGLVAQEIMRQIAGQGGPDGR